MPGIGLKYGAPSSVIHRGDLQRVLLAAAISSGCRVLTSQQVVMVDSKFSASIQVLDHRTGGAFWLRGDIVIAADGTRSALRRQMATAMGIPDQSIPTGDEAYRLLIPREKIQHDPRLLAMLDQNVAMRYMGPGGHVMAYPVKNNTLYNIVLLHPDEKAVDHVQQESSHKAEEDQWTTRGTREEMLSEYRSWSPLIRTWLSHVTDDESVLKWRLRTHPSLPSWVRGRVALAGDACHPMLPYVAQGAAQGLEDAGVLAVALTCTGDVDVALGVYEAVRKGRAERIAASATATGKSLHLSDGQAQRARDEVIRGEEGKDVVSEDKWRDEEWREYMWKTDVMRETLENWEALEREVKAKKPKQVDCAAKEEEIRVDDKAGISHDHSITLARTRGRLRPNLSKLLGKLGVAS
jgi:salicylate hydroxylase